MHNLTKFKQHGLSILGGFQCLFYHILGIWVQILRYGRQNNNHVCSDSICFRSQMLCEEVVCQGTCPLQRGTEGLETQKSCKMIYLWSFILSCLCCRTIYRGVAVLVSIIKMVFETHLGNTHCTREEKSQRQKKKKKTKKYKRTETYQKA